MKRKTKGCRVCTAQPDGTVSGMGWRELASQVRWGMKAIEMATSAPQRAAMGLRLGQLCCDAGHHAWALHVWTTTLHLVRQDNYDLVDLPINPRFYRFDGLYAYHEEQQLASRIDALLRRLGHPEHARYLDSVAATYRRVWLYKYQEPYWEY